MIGYDATMGSLTATIVKTALVFAVIGMTLAFAGPYIAGAIGMSSFVAANPIFQAAFFGIFGAMSAALMPLADAIFSPRSTGNSNLRDAKNTLALSAEPHVAIMPDLPQPTIVSAAMPSSLSSFRDRARPSSVQAELITR